MKRGFVVLLIVFALLSLTVFAQQTTIIALQGKLINESTGALIQSTTIRVNVSNVLGETIWNQTYANAVTSGFFDLLLGSDTTNELNLTYNEDYNISIYIADSANQVGGTYRFRGGQGLISPSNLSSGNFTNVGNFTFGSVLHVDKTNSRVGIGTNVPGQELEISGDIVASAGISTGSRSVASDTLNTGTLWINGRSSVAASSDVLLVGAGAAWTDQALYTGGSERVRIDSSGNVGIGTSSPDDALEVVLGSGNRIKISGPGGNNVDSGGISFAETQDIASFNLTLDGSNNNLKLSSIENENLMVWRRVTGNVGIGTSDPSEALHVIGNVTVPDGAISNLGEGGLLCKAFNNSADTYRLMTGKHVKQWVAQSINFSSIDPEGMLNYYSIRCVGYIKPLYSETYTIYGTGDDGVRVWVNNTPMADGWVNQAPATYSGTITLTADVWYPIVVEHYENSGGQFLEVNWSSASQSNEVIPSTALAFSMHEQAPSLFGQIYVGGTTETNTVRGNVNLTLESVDGSVIVQLGNSG